MTMLGNRPREKKSSFGPPPKKRKATHAVEEIKFDFDARSDYLTGFHKRKLQRVKTAQEEAAKRRYEEFVRSKRGRKESKARKEVLVDLCCSAVSAVAVLSFIAAVVLR